METTSTETTSENTINIETIEINKASYETRVVYKQINKRKIESIISLYTSEKNNKYSSEESSKFKVILNKLDKLFIEMKDARDDMIKANDIKNVNEFLKKNTPRDLIKMKVAIKQVYDNTTKAYNEFLINCPHLASSVNTYSLINVIKNIKAGKNGMHIKMIKFIKMSFGSNNTQNKYMSFVGDTFHHHVNSVIQIICSLSLLLDHISRININKKTKIIISRTNKSKRKPVKVMLNDTNKNTKSCKDCGFVKKCYCYVIKPVIMEPCRRDTITMSLVDIIGLYVYMYNIYNVEDPCKGINKYFTYGKVQKGSDMYCSICKKYQVSIPRKSLSCTQCERSCCHECIKDIIRTRVVENKSYKTMFSCPFGGKPHDTEETLAIANPQYKKFKNYKRGGYAGFDYNNDGYCSSFISNCLSVGKIYNKEHLFNACEIHTTRVSGTCTGEQPTEHNDVMCSGCVKLLATLISKADFEELCKNYVICPTCKTLIYRIDGCDHITCGFTKDNITYGCGTQFCFVCDFKINKGENWPAHNFCKKRACTERPNVKLMMEVLKNTEKPKPT